MVVSLLLLLLGDKCQKKKKKLRRQQQKGGTALFCLLVGEKVCQHQHCDTLTHTQLHWSAAAVVQSICQHILCLSGWHLFVSFHSLTERKVWLDCQKRGVLQASGLIRPPEWWWWCKLGHFFIALAFQHCTILEILPQLFKLKRNHWHSFLVRRKLSCSSSSSSSTTSWPTKEHFFNSI